MSAARTVFACSSLEKIFPSDTAVETEMQSFSLFQNETLSFQIAFSAAKDAEVTLELQTALKDAVRPYSVNMIPAGANAPKFADDYFIAKNKSEYPELLLPISDNRFKTAYDGMNVLWFELRSSDLLPAGTYPLTVTLLIDGEPVTQTVTITVLEGVLPPQSLIYTNWFHSDCLASYYDVPVFSEEYWRIVKAYLQRAAEYGMNCVLTPLFTPPLDTKVGGERPTVQLVAVEQVEKNKYQFGFEKLDRWIEMCEACGIQYFEMCHLFTQWGAKHAPKIMATADGTYKQIFGWKTRAAGKAYRLFLQQFGKALLAHLDEKGIRDRCLFHISDEPNKRMLRAYKKASKIAHAAFPGVKFVDALSDFKLYESGLVDTPIPANDHIEPFLGKVPELWTYYCCVQARKNVSNRFFAMPSARNRILGAQLYKFQAKGFLHWGYNFYFLQYSKGLIDPYKVTDAGGAFYSGDSFVVYPAKDGTPYNSLRLHVFFDALQDMRALQLLESKVGREKTIQILEADTEKPITFSEYPHSAKWLLDMRDRVNRAIQQAD